MTTTSDAAAARLNKPEIFDVKPGGPHPGISLMGVVLIRLVPERDYLHMGGSHPAPEPLPAEGTRDELGTLRFQVAKLRGLAGAVLDGRPHAARELRAFLAQIGPT